MAGPLRQGNCYHAGKATLTQRLMGMHLFQWFPFRSLLNPAAAFAELSNAHPDPTRMFFRRILWLALAPPAFVFVGSSLFGWRLGAAEPLRLPGDVLTLIGIGYFLALAFGFVSTAVLSRWMASTYGARDQLGVHFALVTIVAMPIVIASVCHLFPHVFINMLALIPALLWSLYLLYKGLPVALGIEPERGMLMASALVGCLLVGAVGLLGLTVALWTNGIGPAIGI